MPLRSARLFYDVSERTRRVIESYFMLNSTLHFSYTHLVCRTAITGDTYIQTRTKTYPTPPWTHTPHMQNMPLVYLCVCVCVVVGQQDHRNDLSHPIHADNCLLDPEANECWKEPPAYTYRDYRSESSSACLPSGSTRQNFLSLPKININGFAVVFSVLFCT